MSRFSEWFGIIVVKTGVFAGGIFRFTLTLPPTFPDTEQIPVCSSLLLYNYISNLQTIELEQTLLHPLIHSKTRRVDLRRLFTSGWIADRCHIYHVLQSFQVCSHLAKDFYPFLSCLEHLFPLSMRRRGGRKSRGGAALARKSPPIQTIREYGGSVRFICYKVYIRSNCRFSESRTQIYDLPRSDDPQAFRQAAQIRLYSFCKRAISCFAVSSRGTRRLWSRFEARYSKNRHHHLKKPRHSSAAAIRNSTRFFAPIEPRISATSMKRQRQRQKWLKMARFVVARIRVFVVKTALLVATSKRRRSR